MKSRLFRKNCRIVSFSIYITINLLEFSPYVCNRFKNMSQFNDFDESFVGASMHRKKQAVILSDDSDSNSDVEESYENIDDSLEAEDQMTDFRTSTKINSKSVYNTEEESDENIEDSLEEEDGDLTKISTSSNINVNNDSYTNEKSDDENIDSFEESTKDSKNNSYIDENGKNVDEGELPKNATPPDLNIEADDSTDEDLFDVGVNTFNAECSIFEGDHVTAEVPLNIVEISSEDETPPLRLSKDNLSSLVKPERIQVNEGQHEEQLGLVRTLEANLFRAQNAMKVIKMENLPDKGKSLVEKHNSLKIMLQQQREVLNKMIVIQDKKPTLQQVNKVEVAWDEIQAGVNTVAPRTMGVKGVARFKAEKNMAMETLDHLHKSLASCPTEADVVEEPKGLKVSLMMHQKSAVAWLLWREKQQPSGGLLADDMGLGKTLTMISLVIKSMELEADSNEDKENYRDKYPGGTLVVCPASLLNQWSSEVEQRTKRGLLSLEVHHGPKRETKSKRLARYDMVVTTYAIVLSESEKSGTLFGVRWRRIILDEAHQIRNHKARTSTAICTLSGKSRWALTGTPVHNKELDIYSILKFLRCSPFDDLQVWKHWVSDKSSGGQQRLHAVISSLMLRRTKAELMGNGTLQSLPERKWELISVKLDKGEMDVYQKILIFSRTLFAHFLHQRAEKAQDAINYKFNEAPPDPNGEYFKMRNRLLKLNKVKDVSQTDILVLLLRLRQICCHPSLIIKMLQGNEDLGNADDEEECEELNLLEQLNKMTLQDDDQATPAANQKSVGLNEASKGYLNPSNPIFSQNYRSSKVKILVNLLKEKIRSEDKAIVVSQWTSLLHLISIHLKAESIVFASLDGSVLVNKRMEIVDNFNDPKSATKVLLLSLTAGGVGLNLIGANHLFLLDLHWNPQLENQAQDRIYRMGQTKPIFVYKLMALETIEERIKGLQESKLEIANSMLTGSKKVISSKLTLQDLKQIFEFK